jgi:predicted nuclease with TOPRIM domain
MASIFGEIEKLINEHGSANILRERLALAKEQYEDLEKKFLESQQKNKSFVDQIKLLEEENDKLKEENKKLKTKLEELTKTNGGKLSEPEENILCLLSSCERLTPEVIASKLGLNLTKTEYYLERMRNKYVSAYDYTSGPSKYILNQEGREYLIENNLIE